MSNTLHPTAYSVSNWFTHCRPRYPIESGPGPRPAYYP